MTNPKHFTELKQDVEEILQGSSAVYGVDNSPHFVTALEILKRNYKKIFANQGLLTKRVEALSKLHQKAVEETEDKIGKIAELKRENEGFSQEVDMLKKKLNQQLNAMISLQRENQILKNKYGEILKINEELDKNYLILNKYLTMELYQSY